MFVEFSLLFIQCDSVSALAATLHLPIRPLFAVLFPFPLSPLSVLSLSTISHFSDVFFFLAMPIRLHFLFHLSHSLTLPSFTVSLCISRTLLSFTVSQYISLVSASTHSDNK